MVFYGVHDVRGFRGGLIKAQKWMYRERVFRVNIVLFLFKQRDQNKEGGMHRDGGCV